MRMEPTGLDMYRANINECYKSVKRNTFESVNELSEERLNEVCNTAIEERDNIGDVDSPQVNAAVFAHSNHYEEALQSVDVVYRYERNEKFLAKLLANLAQTAAKLDLMKHIHDEGDDERPQVASRSGKNETNSSAMTPTDTQPKEETTDAVVEALPKRAMPMDELHEFLHTVDIPIRGRKPLPHFYEDTAFPTAFYLLSPPGFRAYAYNEEKEEWCLVTVVENNDDDRSMDGMQEIKDAVREWRKETPGVPSGSTDGRA